MNSHNRLTGCSTGVIVTAGSLYLDIDAYACSVAMRELLELKGERAVAYSPAPCNYSVCDLVVSKGELLTELPDGFSAQASRYIIVDVSDPEYIKDRVPLDNVVEIYDHHTGFETFWAERIGSKAHIEFIGAAATLIFREWKNAGLTDKMNRSTALLLAAAILDNTLNLTSLNTTAEDKDAYRALCGIAGVSGEWRALYFSEVQKNVEADLKNALFKDIKIIRGNRILPPHMAQLCVWDAERILEKLTQIRCWFAERQGEWMMNIIDVSRHCSFFVCDDAGIQEKLAVVFPLRFHNGIAVSEVPYLRKEIIKKTTRIPC